MYRILFWFSLAVAAVLIIPNMAYPLGGPTAFFLWMRVEPWFAMIGAIIVGFAIGLGFSHYGFGTKKVEEEDLYFN